MATIHVSQVAGNDANPGTQAQPVRTIAQGQVLAVSGDTVLVEGGTYSEAISPSAGETYKAAAGPRPILDGGGTLDHAFFTNSSERINIRIEGFEIRNYRLTGVRLQVGTRALVTNNVVHNNHIHHIGNDGQTTAAYGVYLIYGNTRVTNNEIHHIGHQSGNESTGIWAGYSNDYLIDSNVIYAARKEGFRDYFGLRAKVTNNRVFQCWIGIALNKSCAALVANNYVYYCTGALNPKHTNEPQTKTPWGLAADDPTIPFCRFYHNTCYRSSDNHLWLAINLDPNGTTGHMWDCDIRNNIFHGLAGSHIWDNPAVRMGTTIINYNIYTPTGGFANPPATPADAPVHFWRRLYAFGSNVKTMAQTQTDYGWNANSQLVNPQLNDPIAGDLDYGAGSPAAAGGTNLGGTWGSQMGARGLPASPATFTPARPATAIASKSASVSTNNRVRAADELQPIYFNTTSTTEEWIVFDFGSSKSFNTVVQDPYAHAQSVNIRNYRIEVSNDNVTYTVAKEATSPDNGGATYKYELAATQTARYVRFTAVSSFGANVIFGDIRFGLLERTDPGDPPPTPDTTAPTVSLTAPANGASVSDNVTVTATASDNVGVTKVEFYVGTVLLATVTVAPYTTIWATTSADAGSRTLSAKAYDGAGNSTTSATRTVTVTTSDPPTDAIVEYWGALI